MKTFQEFHEDAKVEAAFQEILQEYGPGLFVGPYPKPTDIGYHDAHGSFEPLEGIGETPDIIPGFREIMEYILGKIGPAVSVFFGAKLLGRGVNYILKKNRERLEKANNEIDFEKNFEKEIKLAEIEKEGEKLSDEQIQNLKELLSKQLAKKYPHKEQGKWLDILDKFASFMRTKTGAGLATIAFILV
jgi:predicted RNA-binding protein YlxR (DUF448 family)|tara:strand:+ start:727 stop:1290 length:564 start_codon:yes stop_codon:yes gene_type:complete